ncbi:hypothetical protein SNEBB_008109 [Seison nebaliae]|nr:hypothetical protein SNEBB_008109 [Seison nebaliae]
MKSFFNIDYESATRSSSNLEDIPTVKENEKEEEKENDDNKQIDNSKLIPSEKSTEIIDDVITNTSTIINEKEENIYKDDSPTLSLTENTVEIVIDPNDSVIDSKKENEDISQSINKKIIQDTQSEDPINSYIQNYDLNIVKGNTRDNSPERLSANQPPKASPINLSGLRLSSGKEKTVLTFPEKQDILDAHRLSRYSTRLSNLVHNEKINLTWKDVSAELLESNLNCCRKVVEKPILKRVSGYVKGGSFLSILGPRCSGKSSLLDALSFRRSAFIETTGSIWLNNFEGSKYLMSKNCCYIRQKIKFMNELTVMEHLNFHAHLRMKPHKDHSKFDRIQQLVRDLKLENCHRSIIGDQRNSSGISQGERKKLAIATELLSEPNILFCDEPTSNVDSHYGLTITKLLAQIAGEGVTVIATYSRPSLAMFRTFNNILFLVNGEQFYFGRTIDAIKYFQTKLKITCPLNSNIFDVISEKFDYRTLVPGNIVKDIRNARQKFENSVEKKELLDKVEKFRASKEAQIEGTEHKWGRKKLRVMDYAASWPKQFSWLIWRDYIYLKRARTIIFGIVYLQLEPDQESIQNFTSATFLMIVFCSFASTFHVVYSLPIQLKTFHREYAKRIYSASSFYLAKALLYTITMWIVMFVFITISYWMIGFQTSVTLYLLFVSTLGLVCSTAVAFGMIISSFSINVEFAVGLSIPIVIPFILYGSFFLNPRSSSDYLFWLKYLSWFNYAFRILMVNQWQEIGNLHCNYTFEDSLPCITTGKDVIKYLQIDDDSIDLNFGGLCAILVVYHVVAFTITFFKNFRNK